MSNLKVLEKAQGEKLSVNELKLIKTIISNVNDTVALVFGVDSWTQIDDESIHDMCHALNTAWIELYDRIEQQKGKQ